MAYTPCIRLVLRSGKMWMSTKFTTVDEIHRLNREMQVGIKVEMMRIELGLRAAELHVCVGFQCFDCIIFGPCFALPRFIQHHRCIGPHVDATNVCLELMFQPLPMSIPFFGGLSLPHLSSSSLACQVFSRIPQLPSVALVLECISMGSGF